MRSGFFRLALSGLFLAGLAGCFGGGGSSPQVILVTTTGATGGSITLSGGGILIFNSDPDGAIVWTINGDFTCLGEVDLRDVGFIVRIVVEGDAILSCEILLPPDGSPPTGGLSVDGPATTPPPTVLEVVVAGRISIGDGFSPFGTGSVHITDDETMLMTPSEYDTDAETDDPTCGDPTGLTPDCDLLLPPNDTTPPTALAAPPAPQASHCVPGMHNVTGPLAPKPAQQNLSQGNPPTGPIGLVFWFRCDVVWGEDALGNLVPVTLNPPNWNPRPNKVKNTSGDPVPGPASATGSNGRKGLTLNVRTNGKMIFKGVTTWNLMDGGDGQCAVVTGAGATAVGGDGAKSGNMKARAGGGFDFSAGSLVINPGQGGDGGCAIAVGINGIDGCPGTPGFAAVATGGAGGENRKKFTVRGFDPSGKISIGPLVGGDGGLADATGGFGGDGVDGPPGCNGGLGADATATGGDGGDVSFSYSGPGSIGTPSTIEGGDGGSADSDSGRGGDGGHWIPFFGGNGANGGASNATGGIMGEDVSGATLFGKGAAPVAATDGTADANQTGDGGDCGNYFGANGTGGAWSQTVGGAPAGSGVFPDGLIPCNPPPIVFIQPANTMLVATSMDDPLLGGPTVVIRSGGNKLDPQNETDNKDFAEKQIPIEMVELQLCSVNPIEFGGALNVDLEWDVTVPIGPIGPPDIFGDQKCWIFVWKDPFAPTAFLFQFGIVPLNPLDSPFDHEVHMTFFGD